MVPIGAALCHVGAAATADGPPAPGQGATSKLGGCGDVAPHPPAVAPGAGKPEGATAGGHGAVSNDGAAGAAPMGAIAANPPARGDHGAVSNDGVDGATLIGVGSTCCGGAGATGTGAAAGCSTHAGGLTPPIIGGGGATTVGLGATPPGHAAVAAGV